jgi:hypothetical protein
VLALNGLGKVLRANMSPHAPVSDAENLVCRMAVFVHVPCRDETTVLALNGLGKVLQANMSTRAPVSEPWVPRGCVCAFFAGMRPLCWL